MIRLMVLVLALLMAITTLLIDAARIGEPPPHLLFQEIDADGARLVRLSPDGVVRRVVEPLPIPLCGLSGGPDHYLIVRRPDSDPALDCLFTTTYTISQRTTAGESARQTVDAGAVRFIEPQGRLRLLNGQILDVATGRPIATWDETDARWFSVGPDDCIALIASTANGESLLLWDGQRLQLLLEDRSFDGLPPIWSPDGQRLAVSIDSDIHVLDIAGRELLLIVAMPGRPIERGVWSADGRYIALQARVSGTAVYSIDVQTRRVVQISGFMSQQHSFVWAAAHLFFNDSSGRLVRVDGAGRMRTVLTPPRTQVQFLAYAAVPALHLNARPLLRGAIGMLLMTLLVVLLWRRWP